MRKRARETIHNLTKQNARLATELAKIKMVDEASGWRTIAHLEDNVRALKLRISVLVREIHELKLERSSNNE